MRMKKLEQTRYLYLFEFENMIFVTDDEFYFLEEETGKLGKISEEKAKEYIDKYDYHIETGLIKDAWVKIVIAEYINEIVEM